MSLPKVEILGLGRLGKIILEKLCRNDISVSGTKRKIESNSKYDQAFIQELDITQLNDDTLKYLSEIDSPIIITLPPSASKNIEDWKNLVQALPANIPIYYTSSIGALKKPYIEEIENVFLTKGATIWRLGGLIFKDSHPAKFLSGKSLSNGDEPINLVDTQDVADILIRCLEKEIHRNMIYHIVCPYHPFKRDYYPQVCSLLGIAAPLYDDTQSSSGDIIESDFPQWTQYYWKNPRLIP